ncbi:MarR family transcriptional regulator [Candidatus Izimaplasma bacterium]|nr:MarR family transcriptional regulator [Candidatus Izimaplasma bacterium]
MENTQIMIALQKLNITINKTVGNDLKRYNLNPSEFGILAHLYVQGRSKTQRIGEIVFITSGAITYFTNKFVNKGLITRLQDENDKRIYWLELTEKGKEFYLEVIEKHTEYLNNLFAKFNEIEKETLYTHLRYFDKELKKEQ